MLLYWIFGVFIVMLVVYLIRQRSSAETQLIEGMDTATPDAASSTGDSACDASLVSFKNAGSIQALKDTVNKLADQISSLQQTQTNNSAAIQQLQAQATKFDDIAQQAEELATQNKDRLLQIAQESQQKYNDAKNSLAGIPSIQGGGSGDATTGSQ